MADKMLTDVTELQQEFYSRWQKADTRGGEICKFCNACNNDLGIEYHMPNCARLDYLVQHYGVSAHSSDAPYLTEEVHGHERRLPKYKWVPLEYDAKDRR